MTFEAFALNGSEVSADFADPAVRRARLSAMPSSAGTGE
jgi:hypothetical protein